MSAPVFWAEAVRIVADLQRGNPSPEEWHFQIEPADDDDYPPFDRAVMEAGG